MATNAVALTKSAFLQQAEDFDCGYGEDPDVLLFGVEAVDSADPIGANPTAEQRDGLAGHAGTEQEPAHRLQLQNLAAGFFHCLAPGDLIGRFAFVDNAGDHLQQPRCD